MHRVSVVQLLSFEIVPRRHRYDMRKAGALLRPFHKSLQCAISRCNIKEGNEAHKAGDGGSWMAGSFSQAPPEVAYDRVI